LLPCSAMSTAPTASGVVLRRLDSLTRNELPPMDVCTTMRMVWLLKLGPPMVMLGPQVAKVANRCAEGPESGCAAAEVTPAATSASAASADNNRLLVVVTEFSSRRRALSAGRRPGGDRRPDTGHYYDRRHRQPCLATVQHQQRQTSDVRARRAQFEVVDLR